MTNYEAMLNRLKLYRKQNGLLQRQMAEKLHSTQECYSYLENGETKISYENVMQLNDMGLSVNYLISGNENVIEAKDLDNVLKGIRDIETREFILKVILELIVRFLGKKEYASDNKTEIDLLKKTLKYWDDFSMIQIVREQLNVSQSVMADKLHVSVKKYRELEKQKRFPDAELIMILYDLSGYEPDLFVDSSDRKYMIARKTWKLLNPNDAGKLIKIAKELCNILDLT